MFDPYVLFGGLIAGAVTLVVVYLYWLERGNDYDQAFPRTVIDTVNDSVKANNTKQPKNKKKKRAAEVTENAPVRQEKKEAPSSTTAPTPATPSNAPATPKVKAVAANGSKTTVAPSIQQEQSSPLVEVQETQNEPPKEVKKKTPKPLNAKDLDLKKVVSRLSAITDLDEAYVQSVSSAFRDAENRKTEQSALQKKLQEANTKIERLQKEKASAEQRAKDEQTQRLQLGEKTRALQTRETDLNRQLTNTSGVFHAREQEQAKEVQNARTKVQQLESELTTTKANYARASAQLRSSQHQIGEEQKKLQRQKQEFDAEIAKRSAATTTADANFASLTKVVEMTEVKCTQASSEIASLHQQNQQLAGEVAELTDALQATRLALQNQTIHGNEHNSRLEQLKEENTAMMTEREADKQSRTQMETKIKSLEAYVSDLTTAKLTHQELIASLEQQVVDHANQKKQFEVKEQTLLKQVKDGQASLAAAKREIEKEQSRIVEIPKNTEPVEEVFELKKTGGDLEAAPSTSRSDANEVERLKSEVATLQEKNMELRQRNMNILEKTEAAPNQLVKERKQVAAEFGKLSEKQFKNFTDEEAFGEWVHESACGIQKKLSSKQTPASTATRSNESKQCSALVQHVAAGNEGECRKALVVLMKQLDKIQALADSTEKRLEEAEYQLQARSS